jgi:hypothetical protein
VDNVLIVCKEDNRTMKTSQGGVFTHDGEFCEDGDLPDDPYDRE